MCTRYLLRRPVAELVAALGVTAFPSPLPRYNAAPKQSLPVVRRTPGPARRREAAALAWGLVPHWSPTPSTTKALINARAESAAEKPAFREALRHRRCVVPADGFYEWKRTGHGPRPWLFEHTGGELLLLAGLWDRWAGPGAEPFESFAVLTTTPNAVVAPLHDRMPVLLPAVALEEWLDVATPPARVAALLAPCPAALLRARAVHPRLNDVRYDDPSCLEPPPPEAPPADQLELGLR